MTSPCLYFKMRVALSLSGSAAESTDLASHLRVRAAVRASYIAPVVAPPTTHSQEQAQRDIRAGMSLAFPSPESWEGLSPQPHAVFGRQAASARFLPVHQPCKEWIYAQETKWGSYEQRAGQARGESKRGGVSARESGPACHGTTRLRWTV